MQRKKEIVEKTESKQRRGEEPLFVSYTIYVIHNMMVLWFVFKCAFIFVQ